MSASARKYGRYDFSRFDHSSSGFASAGSKVIGKVHVDCQFLFRKSQWGVLGDEEFPAGVIYLNLNLGPPQGSTVKSATVTVTLDSDDPCLRPYRIGRRLHPSGAPLQITNWFGPKQLVGSQTKKETTWRTKLAPEFNVAGMGGGGLGVESEKSFASTSRWSFNGQLLRSKTGWWYTTLKWDIEENELQKASRGNQIHTAFAFEHSGQPFLMKVEIEGKLEKWRHRVKEKLRFGPKDKAADTTTTLIDFGEYRRFRQPLDELARGLPRAMEMENLEEVPIEIPEPTVPTFQSAVHNESPREQDLAARSSARTGEMAEISPPAGTTEPVRQRTLEAADSTQPTVEDFRQALNAFSSPADVTVTAADNSNVVEENTEPPGSADTTLVNSTESVTSHVETSHSIHARNEPDMEAEVQHRAEKDTTQDDLSLERQVQEEPAQKTVQEKKPARQKKPKRRSVVENAEETGLDVSAASWTVVENAWSDPTPRRTTIVSRDCDMPPVVETIEEPNMEAIMELVAAIPLLLPTLRLLLWARDLIIRIIALLSGLISGRVKIKFKEERKGKRVSTSETIVEGRRRRRRHERM
jgi:hypothetical protein